MKNNLLKKYIKKSLALRRAARWYRAKTDGYPDWKRILSRDVEQWRQALRMSENGPNVLVATSVGAHLPGTTLESLLSVALTLRKAKVHILLCDLFLPACLESHISWYPDAERFTLHGPQKDLCKDCFKPADDMYRSLGLSVHHYSNLVTAEEVKTAAKISSELAREEIDSYMFDGIAVGEHALAGTLRFFSRGSLDSEPYEESILRRYLNASLLTTFAIRRLFSQISFNCAVFHHGIYVPQGLIGEVARQKKVRVVNWNPAYRKKCFIFSHGDTYHHTLMSEPVDKWENIPWTPKIESGLMTYLKSRWYGTKDWILFHENPEVDLKVITDKVGIDFSRPCIGMLTNVMWDAQLHYPANVFNNMLDWILQTISYFIKRSDLQLLIRVHPAEIRGSLPSRQLVVDEIKRNFPSLPKNIFIIPPASHVSTYAAMSQCNAVIIYGTKTGVELSSMGIPVIVAGEAWVRNKGITIDATSVAHYLNLLDQLPMEGKLDNATVSRARKYAFHFFFRRMIPLDFMQPVNGWPPYKVPLLDLEELEPGGCSGLDIVCDGILNKADFIYPAENS